MTILDCLAAYESTSATEAEHILESILPKLQHANYAVVLACIRVILSKLHQVQVCVVLNLGFRLLTLFYSTCESLYYNELFLHSSQC